MEGAKLFFKSMYLKEHKLSPDVLRYIVSLSSYNEEGIIEKMYKEYNGQHCLCVENDYHTENHYFDREKSITKNEKGYVTEINICPDDEGDYKYGIIGCDYQSDIPLTPSRILPEIGKLFYLERITFMDVNLIGSIPKEIGNLRNLTHLEIVCGNLTQLEIVCGIDNNDYIDLPKTLSNLQKLECLNLSYFKLTSDSLNVISTLTNLKGLSLKCYLDKIIEIPEWISNFKYMEYLSLNRNFQGEIPLFIKDLKNLKSFTFNGVKGKVPNFLFSSSLDSLFLSSNSSFFINFTEEFEKKPIKYMNIFNCDIIGEKPAIYADKIETKEERRLEEELWASQEGRL